MSDAVVSWQQEGSVAVCTISRPKALNALNTSVIEGLISAFAKAQSDASLRAVVLTGAGEKAFVAGADIAEMQSLTAGQAERFAVKGQALGQQLATFPRPIIAAVQGFALGGGCELAMACDIVLAGERAKFGQPEVKLGVIPGFGGTQRLTRRVGLAVAMDLCLTGRMVGAAEAVAIGLASRAVQGDVQQTALEVAHTIASMGPEAVRLCKRALLENADTALDSALAAERSLFGLCFATQDQQEGMAAFLAKRPPAFKGY